MSSDALCGLTPIEKAMAFKGDISPLLKFHWWETVLYQAKGGIPSDSHEMGGTWCGIVESQGNILAYLVLTDNTQEVTLLVLTFALSTILIIHQIFMRHKAPGRHRGWYSKPQPLSFMHLT